MVRLHRRFPSLLSTVVLTICAGTAAAQTAERAPVVLDRFPRDCSAALASPDAFYRDALAKGQTSPAAVGTTEDRAIYVIADMSMVPVIAFAVGIGEISGQTAVECHAEMYVDPTTATLERNTAAFLAATEAMPGVTLAGGTLEANGILTWHLDPSETVAEYVVSGWLSADQDVIASVQKERIALDAARLLPQPFTADD